MAGSIPDDQDVLGKAIWISIVDAVRQNQLQSLLEQRSSHEVITPLKKSGLGAQAPTAEILTELRRLPSTWEDLFSLQVLLAAATIHSDRDLFKTCDEKCSARGIEVLERLQALVYKVPEGFIFLSHLDWRGLGSDRSSAKLFISAALEPYPKEEWPITLRFLHLSDGIPAEEDWKYLALNKPSPTLLDYVLKLHPEGVLNYGMLQNLASGGYYPDVVKKLIDAGANVNLDPPVHDWGDVRDGARPFRPLWFIAFHSGPNEAPENQKRYMDAAQLLLEHGADVHLRAHDSDGWKKSALQTVREKGNVELIKLYERYEDRGTSASGSGQSDENTAKTY